MTLAATGKRLRLVPLGGLQRVKPFAFTPRHPARFAVDAGSARSVIDDRAFDVDFFFPFDMAKELKKLAVTAMRAFG